jgi:protein SCO1/2
MRCVNVILFTFFISLAIHPVASAEERTAEASQEADASLGAPAHEGHDHEAMEREPKLEAEVGVDERLGERVSLDVSFVDEQGRELRLGEAINKPTLVLPVFFSCTVTCPMMLANLAQAINDVPLTLGEDYGVLALSFDEEEGSELAQMAKGNYSRILKKELPLEEWKFLTGEKESVRTFTDSIGFRFKKTGEHMFIHPNVMIALAPDGTIIRYLYGPRFLPFDIGMALTEAAKGTPGLSIRKLLTYCFDYDTESRSYIVRSFRLFALGILAVLAIVFFFVIRKRQTDSLEETEKG